MKLAAVIDRLELCPFAVEDREIEVTGAYCGDLLSDVLAHVEAGALWFTIQNHLNIVAVGQLKDVACIVIVNDVAPDPQTVSKAQALGVNLCGSSRGSAELCMELARLPEFSP